MMRKKIPRFLRGYFKKPKAKRGKRPKNNQLIKEVKQAVNGRVSVRRTNKKRHKTPEEIWKEEKQK